MRPIALLLLMSGLCSAQELVRGQPTQRWNPKTNTWTSLETGQQYRTHYVAGGEIVKPIEKTEEAKRIDRLAYSGAVVDFGSRKLYASYTCGQPIVVTSGQCWWCPRCNKWHCGPKPGGQGGTQPPGEQEDYPQYEPYPPDNTEPPADPPTVEPPATEPPTTNPPLPPPPTEPTIDQAALDQFKAEAVSEATAAAKAEVSVLIKQELQGVESCNCGPKWADLDVRLTEIETAIANQQTVNESNLAAWEDQRSVNNNIDNSVTELSDAVDNFRFSIRVVDPRGLYTTPYAEVRNGQKVDLTLSPLTPVQ